MVKGERDEVYGETSACFDYNVGSKRDKLNEEKRGLRVRCRISKKWILREEESWACPQYTLRSRIITLSTPQSQTPAPPPSSEPPTPPTESKIQQNFVPVDFNNPANNLSSMQQPPSQPQTLPAGPKIQQHFVPVDFNNLANNLSSIQRPEDIRAIMRRMTEKWEKANLTPAQKAAARERNIKEWTSWANTALDYYNEKQGAKFKFVKIIGVVSNACMPLRLVHINFGAKSDDDGSYRNFFAEMRVPWEWNEQQHKPIVNGCCILEKTDSGEDLNAPACSHCSHHIKQPHPTPRYGCRSASGDLFANMASYY